jgi:hypothetical protein
MASQVAKRCALVALFSQQTRRLSDDDPVRPSALALAAHWTDASHTGETLVTDRGEADVEALKQSIDEYLRDRERAATTVKRGREATILARAYVLAVAKIEVLRVEHNFESDPEGSAYVAQLAHVVYAVLEEGKKRWPNVDPSKLEEVVRSLWQRILVGATA